MSFLSAAGGILLGAVFGVFIAVALLAGGEPGRSDISSFHFEARLERPQLEGVAILYAAVLDRVEGWFEAPNRWRYEFSSSDPLRAYQTVIQVSDGERVWLYQGATNTYLVSDIGEYLGSQEPFSGPPPPPSLLLGPVGTGDFEDFLRLLTSAARITAISRSLGERIAGRATERIDMEDEAGWLSTIWADRNVDFVLRFEATAGPASERRFAAEVEKVSFGKDIDDGLFAFQPPPDAREAEPDDGRSFGSVTSLGNDVPPPEGFKAPAYIPEGYEAVRFESSQSGQDTTSYSVTYEDGSGSVLVVVQNLRAGGLAASQRTGEPLAILGSQGYLQRAGDRTVLLWADGDLVVRVSSDVLDADELLRVAMSMRP